MERVEYSGPVIKGRHPGEIILAAKLAHHFGYQLGRTPPVNGGHQLPGEGTWTPPPTQLKTPTRSGLRRALGDWDGA